MKVINLFKKKQLILFTIELFKGYLTFKHCDHLIAI